jgi:dUTP pyrophosphatase
MCCKDEKVKVLFKKLDNRAVLPTKNKDSDTGYDVYSIDDFVIPANGSATVKCGLQVAYITPGYWFSVRSRSGLAFKSDIVGFDGTIDNEYRGELGIKLFNFSNKDYTIKWGERVIQIAIHKNIESEIEFTEEIDRTERGSNGFGSSGR